MTDESPPDPQRLRRRRAWADLIFRWAAVGAGLVVLVVLGFIAYTLIRKTGPVAREMGLRFFTERRWAPPKQIYGALALIWGTVYTSVIALALAVPVSLGIALFTTQVAPKRMRTPMVYVIDLLAVIPSVVFGMWGLLVLAPHLKGLYRWLHQSFHGWPIIGRFFGAAQTQSFLTAGIVLAVMVVPIMTSLAREVIETTPVADKEAALALGCTKWEMIRGAVMPHSKGGLVGAVMLGLGRAMGETVAVTLTIGGAFGQVTLNALSPGNSMPSLITSEWGEADSLKKSALIAIAVTLFVITIIVNITATAVVRRSIRRSRGAMT